MMDHDLIRKLRSELGISQAALARATGIHRTILSAFETGQLILKGDFARRVRNFFASRGQPLPAQPKRPTPDPVVLDELRRIEQRIGEIECADCNKGFTGLFFEEGEKEREELFILLERRRILEKALQGKVRADAKVPKQPVSQADYLALEYLKFCRKLEKKAG